LDEILEIFETSDNKAGDVFYVQKFKLVRNHTALRDWLNGMISHYSEDFERLPIDYMLADQTTNNIIEVLDRENYMAHAEMESLLGSKLAAALENTLAFYDLVPVGPVMEYELNDPISPPPSVDEWMEINNLSLPKNRKELAVLVDDYIYEISDGDL
jgi:hypothetical protein